MEIGQTNLVTTSSKSIQPDEFLWYAIVETEGFLSGLFACIAYNLEKSLQYHWSASASGQESLDHILLHSSHTLKRRSWIQPHSEGRNNRGLVELQQPALQS